MVPTGNQFNTAPLLRSPQRGRLSQRGEFVPRGSPRKQILPRIQKLSPLCTPPLSAVAPGLPVLRGVSGGGAALSSLCRRPFLRRHNESHFAAEPPERAFLAKPFFARAKNGVNLGRRSHKISVIKSNSTRTPPKLSPSKTPSISAKISPFRRPSEQTISAAPVPHSPSSRFSPTP